MEVILLNKVDNLGNIGDIVKVKAGYGRNFLIPSGRAVPADERHRAEFEARRAEFEKAAAEALAVAQARAEQLEGATVTIARMAGEEGKLFGSVGTADIAEAVTVHGVAVKKQEVRLPSGSLRQTGTYEVELHLHPEVNVAVTIEVTAEA